MKFVPISSLQLHPEANLVPEARDEEYSALLADVKEHGIKVAIEVQPGTSVILDGRTRFRAAQEAGLDKVPVTDAVLDGDDPTTYMLKAAALRRHLSDDQRAMIALEIKRRLSEARAPRRKLPSPWAASSGAAIYALPRWN
jgi:ParB-like chromosome segregation protein Spo0J